MTNESPLTGAGAAAQAWIDECVALVSRRGHRIAFRRTGRGPTVLLVHGPVHLV